MTKSLSSKKFSNGFVFILESNQIFPKCVYVFNLVAKQSYTH